MPIGRFPDWDACIAWAREHDIGSPEAYCGALERQATQGSNMTHVALVAPEGVRTSDRRLINPGALSWREGAPLMFIDKTTEGHDEAQHVGNLTNFRRAIVDGETWLVADLTYDSDEQAREAQRLADEGKIAGVSADIGAVTADLEILEVGEDGMPVDWLETISEGEVLGATQLPMPAFAGARIMSMLDFQASIETVTAAPTFTPPKAWFYMEEPPDDDPRYVAQPSGDLGIPLTITEDGQVYGHAGVWGQCHSGITDRCVRPPRGSEDYSMFHTGLCTTDGGQIPTGTLVWRGDHAPLTADRIGATQHYAHNALAWGDARAVNGRHGVWVAGAVRPEVTDDEREILQRSYWSGDWRGGELIGLLTVNQTGFPLVRHAVAASADRVSILPAARIEDDEVVALVAAGAVPPRPERSRDDLIYEALRLLTDEVRALRVGSDTVNLYVSNDGPTVSDMGEQADERNGRIAAILDATG